MTTLKHYPAYKDASVDWLDDLPQHWPLVRLRSVAQLSASNVDKISSPGETPVRLCNYTNVYYNHLITDDLEFMAGTATPDEIERFSLRGGEVLFTKDSEAFDDIGIPAVADEGLDNVVVGYHLMMARPGKELSGHYFAWFFTPQVNRWQFEVSAKGVTRFGMPQSGFKDALIPLPSLDEQRAIADFLDGMDARITRFIAARRKMIALLEEKKQAVINQAVTRGLDPSVPTKDSGVDWLGEIPGHWDVVALRYRYSVQLGKMLDAKQITGNYLTPYLRNRDVQWGKVNEIDLPEMDILPTESDRYTVLQGDLLVCEGGEVGKSAIWTAENTVGYQKALHRLRPLNPNRDTTSYFYYVMVATAGKGVFSAHGNENTFTHLTGEAFRAYRFAFPPMQEQQAIARFLTDESDRIKTPISRHRREIELMQEYRTRLISDVVTGKLDVRGVELPVVGEVIGEGIEAAMEDATVGEYEEVEA